MICQSALTLENVARNLTLSNKPGWIVGVATGKFGETAEVEIRVGKGIRVGITSGVSVGFGISEVGADGAQEDRRKNINSAIRCFFIYSYCPLSKELMGGNFLIEKFYVKSVEKVAQTLCIIRHSGYPYSNRTHKVLFLHNTAILFKRSKQLLAHSSRKSRLGRIQIV